MRIAPPVVLNAEQRRALERMARQRTLAKRLVERHTLRYRQLDPLLGAPPQNFVGLYIDSLFDIAAHLQLWNQHVPAIVRDRTDNRVEQREIAVRGHNKYLGHILLVEVGNKRLKKKFCPQHYAIVR